MAVAEQQRRAGRKGVVDARGKEVDLSPRFSPADYPAIPQEIALDSRRFYNVE
jgi:hypothetical protein